MHKTKAAIHAANQLVPEARANLDRLHGINVSTVGIESIPPVGCVLDPLQVNCRLGKEQKVAIEEPHALGLQIGDEVENFRREQVGVAKCEAARKAAQQLRELCICLRTRDDSSGWKMLTQSRELSIRKRAVFVDAQGVAPAARDIKGLERPDQVEPVLRGGEDVYLATLVRCVLDWLRRQDARAHHISVPRNPQSVTKSLMKSQPQRARSEPHKRRLVSLLC